jgi:Astacin (Peptidase family M12A).
LKPIHISAQNTSYSNIGRQGGKQDLSFADWATVGTVMHEIGHALGMFHEHSRKDRDSYIIVDYNNIRSDAKHNFDKVSSKISTIIGRVDRQTIEYIYHGRILNPW